MLIPKHKPIRAPKHLAFLRKLPCVVTGYVGHGIEAAHIRLGTNGGTGMKPGDDWAIPMWRDEHRKQHEGEASYWGNRLDKVKELAQNLYDNTGDVETCLRLIRDFKNDRS